MTAKEVTWKLAESWSSPFRARTQAALVPNVSYGLSLDWEADLIACSKSFYLTEVEIKVTFSDWKADFVKKKHELLSSRKEQRIKRFFYAVPVELAGRLQELHLPEYAGVISVGDRIEIVRKAKEMKPCRPITMTEYNQLLRLGALKLWDWNKNK